MNQTLPTSTNQPAAPNVTQPQNSTAVQSTVKEPSKITITNQSADAPNPLKNMLYIVLLTLFFTGCFLLAIWVKNRFFTL